MTEAQVAVACSYIEMRKEARRIIEDLDKGRELNPQTICNMFPWSESCGFLRSLVERRIQECDEKLKELQIEI